MSWYRDSWRPANMLRILLLSGLASLGKNRPPPLKWGFLFCARATFSLQEMLVCISTAMPWRFFSGGHALLIFMIIQSYIELWMEPIPWNAANCYNLITFATHLCFHFCSCVSLVLAEIKPQPRYIEDVEERVVGGEVAPPHTWPWQVRPVSSVWMCEKSTDQPHNHPLLFSTSEKSQISALGLSSSFYETFSGGDIE